VLDVHGRSSLRGLMADQGPNQELAIAFGSTPYSCADNRAKKTLPEEHDLICWASSWTGAEHRVPDAPAELPLVLFIDYRRSWRAHERDPGQLADGAYAACAAYWTSYGQHGREDAVSGTLFIDEITPTRVRGRIDVTLAHGGHAAASFDAERCDGLPRLDPPALAR